ncbi:hypothetical protein KI387_014622, partial [Taxus chinensis]
LAYEYDEEEENNVDDEEDDDDDDDEDMEGYNGIIPQQQSQQHQSHHIQQPLHNGSSQTETTSSGEDGRPYYMQNGDGMHAERLSEQVGVVGEDEFEDPNEEMIKIGDDESGYNENGVEEELLGKDMDAEKIVFITPKGSGKGGSQKRKSLASMGAFGESSGSASKKAKKKNTNVWAKSSSRKGGKKNRAGNGTVAAEDTVNITPVVRVPDKVDDSPDLRICLSKIYKAEKVELSDDRLTASSTKGYRMVRSNRGVAEGAWYFEITVVRLGETGHTRLGWSTEKGDVQAPVGYDANSYSYRDLEGTKVHKAIREPYGEAYVEGDVIGFYINLPNGNEYAPKPPHYAWHKNQLYYYNNPEETPKIVPGIQMSNSLEVNGSLRARQYTLECDEISIIVLLIS